MADPDPPEHADLKDWHGGSFDPGAPDRDELRLQVLKLAGKWHPREEGRPLMAAGSAPRRRPVQV